MKVKDLPRSIRLEKMYEVYSIVKEDHGSLTLSPNNIEKPGTPCLVVTGMSKALESHTGRVFKVVKAVHGHREKLFRWIPRATANYKRVHNFTFTIIPLHPRHVLAYQHMLPPLR